MNNENGTKAKRWIGVSIANAVAAMRRKLSDWRTEIASGKLLDLFSLPSWAVLEIIRPWLGKSNAFRWQLLTLQQWRDDQPSVCRITDMFVWLSVFNVLIGLTL